VLADRHAEIEVSAAPREDEIQQEVFEARAEPVAKEPEETLDFEPSPVPVVEESPPAAPAVETPRVEGIDYDFEPEPASVEAEPPDAGFDPSATVRVDVADDLAAPEIPEKAVEFAPPVAEVEAEPKKPPTIEERPTPPPVKPIEPPAEIPEPAPAMAGEPSRSPEEEARQEEARRFARLLVSEIKLYNEDEVDRGRAEKDIGVRLKDDIERSRDMFEKRIPEDVRTGHDHFRDELVRILADGDADALGV